MKGSLNVAHVDLVIDESVDVILAPEEDVLEARVVVHEVLLD